MKVMKRYRLDYAGMFLDDPMKHKNKQHQTYILM